MSDSRINALGQFSVADNGGMLHASPLFHVKYIIAVQAELLAAVRCYSILAFFLKGRGESLGFFLALFSVHVGDTSKVVVHGLSCFPSVPRPR